MADDVASGVSGSWESEHIPDESRLFLRAHRTFFLADGALRPHVFRDQGDAMSTEWEKYATPAETRQRAQSPQDNAVVALPVDGVRAITDLRVEHSPDWERRNRAHTDVRGEKTTEVRVALSRICAVVLVLEPRM